ncbi:MAG: LytR/AlgR family response regulator transcription factor, partial [Flavitalea sp.]
PAIKRLNMRCAIIDDELNAIEILERYVARLDYVEVIKTFRNPLKASQYLNTNVLDFIFLDINMPDLNGKELLNSLHKKPLVIFTTAYSQYAADSYDLNAVDYLVKPISFERFLKSVHKVQQQLGILAGSQKIQTPEDQQFVLLKSGPQIHRVAISDILYLEKESNYVVVNCTEKKVLMRANFSDLLDLLPSAQFLQVHKSFIVNLSLVDIFEAHQLMIRGRKIPIGHTFKEAVQNTLKK